MRRFHRLKRLSIKTIIITLLIVQSVSVTIFCNTQAQPGPGYYIFGHVRNDAGHYISNVSIKVTNTRTSEFLTTSTDVLGRYSVDISELPSANQFGDIINVTASFNTLGGYNQGEVLEDQTGTIINITIGDITAPEIFHIPVTSGAADEQIIISADIEDDLKVSDAAVWFLLPGESSYDTLTMTLIAGNTSSGTWRVVIPETGKTGVMYYYISANDIAGNNNCSDTYLVDIFHGRPDRFLLYASSETVAGVGFDVTAVIVDEYDNTVKNFTRSVELWTSDPNPLSTADVLYQFVSGDDGTHVFQNAILCTAPSQTIGVHDVSEPSINGTATIVVLANVPASLGIDPDEATMPAGSFSPFILRLLDEYGNAASAVQDINVDLTTTSANGTFLPSATVTFDIGKSESIFLYMDTNVSGSPYMINATSPGLTGADSIVHLVSSDADRWTITPMFVDLQAGDMMSFVLRLQDDYSNAVNVTADTIVNLTTSSPTGLFSMGGEIIEYVVLSENTSFIEFNYTDWNAANSPCIIRANNGTFVADGFAIVNITPASPSRLALSQSALEAAAGANITVNAIILDGFGNICVGLTDTLFINTTDRLATNMSFSFADMQKNGFSFNVTLFSAGIQTLTVECCGGTVNGEIIVTIKPGSAQDLELLTTESVTAGMPFSAVVCVLDGFGNVADGYDGTISFTSDDPYPAILPSPYTFTQDDSASHLFSDDFTLYTIPEGNITIYDDANLLSHTENITVFDTTPPKASFATASLVLTAGEGHNFTLDVWDDVRISEVNLHYSYDNSTYSITGMNQSSGNHSTGIGNYTVELELQEGTLTFYFLITDGANAIAIYDNGGVPFSYEINSGFNLLLILLGIIILLAIVILSFFIIKKQKGIK